PVSPAPQPSHRAALPLARCSGAAHFVCLLLHPFGAWHIGARVRPGIFPLTHWSRLWRPGVPCLRTTLRSVCSPLQPFGPSDARKLACGSPMCPQFAIVVLLRPSACSTPASQFSMVASLRSQSSLEMLPASLGSSAAIAATGCAASFALIGLTT